MTGQELRSIRRSLDLTGDQLGKLLGYQGANIRKIISQFETGERSIPVSIALMVQAYDDGYRPDNWPV